MKVLFSVTSLLLSTALLLLGHGMMLTLLPLRGGMNGISEFVIGLSASGYFLGFIVGCLTLPRLIARIGHIRSFGVLAAVMIISTLCLELLDAWQLWLGLRFVVGVAISGLYAVIESWLTSESSPESRGRLLAVYTFITLSSITAGQFLINVGPVETTIPFSLAAIFMALAIMPVGITRRMAPPSVAAPRIGLRRLYRKSHSAFFGALLAGLVNGSFWSLGALYVIGMGGLPQEVAWFMSAAILGGAIMQYPWGLLSDRMDRRHILILLSAGSAVGASAVAMSSQYSWHLAAVFFFGAMALPIYAISLATAADVSDSEEFVEVGTSVLLTQSIGAVLAPLALGQVMTLFGPVYLFWGAALIAAVFALVLAIFARQPRLVSVQEQTPFSAAAAEVAPVSFELDPRAAESDDADAIAPSS